MVFSYGDTFEQYEAFHISLENYTYAFVKAVMSPEHLKSIRVGEPAYGFMNILRSKSFDIRGMRQEFL